MFGCSKHTAIRNQLLIMFKKKFALSLLLFCASGANAASPIPIYVASTIPYVSPAANGAASPGPDCPWDARLVDYLVKSRGSRVASPMEAQGQRLVLAAKLGPNVGTGEKEAPSWIEVSGTLFDENGKPLGDFGFRDERYSGSLHKCKRAIQLAEGLADSIVNWVEEPSPSIKIAETISTLQEDTVDPEIKKSCPWNTELPAYLSGMVAGSVYRVADDIGTVRGKRLFLTIVSSRLLGGAIYTGSKWLKVKGSLMDNDLEIGSFVALRHSIRGWTGCGISDRLSYQVAYDISNWLQNPSMNARLGDADASTDALP